MVRQATKVILKIIKKLKFNRHMKRLFLSRTGKSDRGKSMQCEVGRRGRHAPPTDKREVTHLAIRIFTRLRSNVKLPSHPLTERGSV